MDGNPESEIIIEIKSKNGSDLERLGRDFCNELINYTNHKKQVEKTKRIRDIILQRALLTIDPSYVNENSSNTSKQESLESISMPWEEKYPSSEEKKGACEKTPIEKTNTP